jgi:GntR family transcriptional regulator
MPQSTTLRRLSTTPIASRAKTAILRAILSGDFADRLPSEEELAEQLQVSRTSIRTALHGLEMEGLITRRRSKGTTVNAHVGPTSLILHRLVGFDWLLKQSGYKVDVEVSWEFRTLPPEFVEAFEVSAATECLVIRKIYSADGIRSIAIADAMPVANLRTRTLAPSLPASLFEFSSHYCKRTIDHAIVELVPSVSGTTRSIADIIPDGKPFIRLHETHYTKGAEVIAWSMIDVHDEYVRMEVVRRQ